MDGYEGNVAVLGTDLRAWDRGYYRRIGVAFEAPNHYLKLTARENLQLFAGLHGGMTGSKGSPGARPEQDGDKLVAEFSKGMRGRLTFARALLHRPGLLFLDEPTAGLDPVTARRIRRVIREARDGGATVFLTTHDMVTANELCDRVAFLVHWPHCSARFAAVAAVGVWSASGPGQNTFPTRKRVECEFPVGGLADDADFLELLRSGAVETIHTLETTLEDVFVQITGRTAQHDPILHALRWDVIVQARNGFYWASAFLVIISSALLLSVPEAARANPAHLDSDHPGH